MSKLLWRNFIFFVVFVVIKLTINDSLTELKLLRDN